MSAPEYDDIIERIMNASAPETEPGPGEKPLQDGTGGTGFRPKRETGPETAMKAGPEAAYEAKPEGAEKAETAAEAEPEQEAGQAAPGKTARARPLPYVAVVVLAAALVLQVWANRKLNDRYDRAMNIWAAESMYYEGDYDASARLVSSLTPDLLYDGADYLIAPDVYAADPEEKLEELAARLRMMGMMLEIFEPYSGRTQPDVFVEHE